MQKPVLSVSEINKYIKDILSNNIILSNVLVRGEISNFKLHHSGHMYFTLKDESSSLKCVMFRSSCLNLKFNPQNGMKVVIQGRVSVYEKSGNYQLYVNDIQPDGVGALHQAFEQLKNKLESEGLFKEEIKKSIPVLPKAIGVVTSPTGAAIRDILDVLKRRFFNIKVIIYPVQVQGEESAQQIAKGIDIFNVCENVDVIITGRGGGSFEELWSFNEEVVARSIANSKIPVVSAVGHETDYTISDFVADLRAPTPSAAAELVIPNKVDVQASLNGLINRLNGAIQKNISQKRMHLEKFITSSVFKQPLDNIYQRRINLDTINKNLTKEFKHLYQNKRQSLDSMIYKLSSLNPLNILQRGYCVSTNQSGVIKSVNQINYEDRIKIKYADGTAECNVIRIDKEESD